MEYQHYLDKAHKQHVEYLEKVRGKNKVPRVRHERYPKLKGLKNNVHQFFHPFTSSVALPQNIYPNLQSIREDFKEDTKLSYTTSRSDSPNLFDATNDRRLLFANTQRSKSSPSSCYCKGNDFPCNCGCKQCYIQFDSINSFNSKSPVYFDNLKTYKDQFLQRDEKYDNDFKIRMKVDIKLPKILERLVNIFSKKDQVDLDASRKDYFMNYISPYLNPSDMLNFNSMPRFSESIPLQRITIHKNKKIRTNSNKKHKKKIINIHGSQTDRNSTIESNLIKNVSQMNNETNTINITNSIQQNSNNTGVNKNLKSDSNKQSKELIYLTLNITNDNENHTDEINKLVNSIETGYFKTKDNFTTIISNRKRRAINNTVESLELSVKPLILLNETASKKFDKLLNDSTLSYWPASQGLLSNNTSKNINSLILNIEKRKSKFNMSRANVHSNHSMALEKAIFGDVDWNDMDTIALVFVSFVDKYVHGVLTFCSDFTCHSMNCANKSCVHRKCDPASRYNKMGHCLGNNSTGKK